MSPFKTSKVPVLVQYVLLAVAWGASFLFIKIGLEGLSPGQVVLGRLVAGAATLAVLCLVTRRTLPSAPVVWAHLTVVAVLLCVAPFLLFAWAEQHISSGLASIYNATTPLMTMVVALALLPQERLSRGRLLGLALGFVGVIVLVAPWNGLGQAGTFGQGACLAATACYGLAFTYLRRYVTPRGLPALSVATVQVGIGATIMLVLAPLLAAQPARVNLRVVLAVLALGAIGTGLAYVWNTNVVAAWGATNASTVTYLTPVVGVVLGVIVLNEQLSWVEPLGALLVILGIAVTQNRLRILRDRRAGRAKRHSHGQTVDDYSI
ncbi:DMT family transporter [Terrabacter sp. BE26]|uniref:DMT family transporter n=1 Tax=Terrabacter sp. BE26 TaxID=2898152 RepID=UPI0035BE9810